MVASRLPSIHFRISHASIYASLIAHCQAFNPIYTHTYVSVLHAFWCHIYPYISVNYHIYICTHKPMLLPYALELPHICVYQYHPLELPYKSMCCHAFLTLYISVCSLPCFWILYIYSSVFMAMLWSHLHIDICLLKCQALDPTYIATFISVYSLPYFWSCIDAYIYDQVFIAMLWSHIYVYIYVLFNVIISYMTSFPRMPTIPLYGS